MEILIFSDSHGRRSRMEEAYSLQPKIPDAVFFLGDGLRDAERVDFGRSELYAVRGNCDFLTADGEPETRTLILEDHKILLAHGHTFSVKSGMGVILSYAAENGIDIVLFGHTHTPVEETVPKGTRIGRTTLTRPVTLFNPGSIASGSFGTLVLKKNAVLFSHGSLA